MTSPDKPPFRSVQAAPLQGDYVAGGSPLTGRKVFAILVAFFGLIMFLNLGVLLPNAISTFRGLETDSAYRASQTFNATLAEAEAQAGRGWRVEASLRREADGRAAAEVVVRDRNGAPLVGLTGEAVLARPADRAMDRAGSIEERGDGGYVARFDDPPMGQWDLVLTLARDGERLFHSRNRVVLR
ncbi:MAG: FixH family protein [Microvirga sp.]|nr:FixH family protein [Microvirga sp.]